MSYERDLAVIRDLALAGGHQDLVAALDDATYGATSGEVSMATRYHLRQFIAAHPTADPRLRLHAARVVKAIDDCLD